jgi:hypothetical protein
MITGIAVIGRQGFWLLALANPMLPLSIRLK